MVCFTPLKSDEHVTVQLVDLTFLPSALTTKNVLFTKSLWLFKITEWITEVCILLVFAIFCWCQRVIIKKMAFQPAVCNNHSWVVKSCEKVRQVYCKVLNWCLTAQVFCLSATVNCTSGRPNDTLYPCSTIDLEWKTRGRIGIGSSLNLNSHLSYSISQPFSLKRRAKCCLKTCCGKTQVSVYDKRSWSGWKYQRVTKSLCPC